MPRFAICSVLLAFPLVVSAADLPVDQTAKTHPAKDLPGKTPTSAKKPGAGGEWPCWRGPTRDGVVLNSPKLLDAWPAAGPRLVWKSGDIPGTGPYGTSQPVVADGKVFLYVTWRHPLGLKDDSQMRPFTAEVLGDLGWQPDLPAALAKKIEEARVAPQKPKYKGNLFSGIPSEAQDARITEQLKKNPELDKYIKDFTATLDAKAVQQYGAYIRRRLCQAGFTWEQLGKLAAAAKDKAFSTDGKKCEEELQKLGFDLTQELAKCGLARDAYNKGIGTPIALRAFKLADVMVCLDAASGKELWKKELGGFDVATRLNYNDVDGDWNAWSELAGTGVEFINWFGSITTPEVVKGKCYIKALTGLYCLSDKDGAVLWKSERGGGHPSVLVTDGVLYAGGEAYDAETGKLLWKGGENWRTSPVLWTSGQNKYIINRNDCFELRTGKLMWHAGWNCGGGMTPVIAGDVLVVTDGAYKLTAEKAEQIWKMPDIYMGTSDCTSPVISQGYLYWYHDWYSECDWWCIDMKTGQVKWKQKSNIPSGTSISSPVLVDGKIIHPLANGHEGELYKVEMLLATPEKFVQLGVFDPKAAYFVSPAIADGKTYLRLKDGIACYDLTAAGNR